jgi:hypothetical protein
MKSSHGDVAGIPESFRRFARIMGNPTVSREVARLEELGLARYRVSTAGSADARSDIRPEGKAATDVVDVAREEIALTLFEGAVISMTWSA